MIWPEPGDQAPPGSWIGAASLALSATAGFVLRHSRPVLASWLVIAGSLCCVTVALLAYRAPDLVYLYLLPLLLTSVLTGRHGLAIVACLSIGLAIFINLSAIGLSPTSRFVGLPASMLALGI